MWSHLVNLSFVAVEQLIDVGQLKKEIAAAFSKAADVKSYFKSILSSLKSKYACLQRYRIVDLTSFATELSSVRWTVWVSNQGRVLPISLLMVAALPAQQPADSCVLRVLEQASLNDFRAGRTWLSMQSIQMMQGKILHDNFSNAHGSWVFVAIINWDTPRALEQLPKERIAWFFERS